MRIEIRKAGFVNKGAELMLYAIMQQLTERYPEATLVMAPSHAGGGQPFHKLTRLGFLPKAWLWRYGIQWGDLTALLPLKLREMYGLVQDKEIDVVLDAAGFSYGDQWGIRSNRELARSSVRWKKKGTISILLPQAFGPFSAPTAKSYVKTWAENIDLIFPRDVDSYKYLTEIAGEKCNIKIHPDFTNLVEGTLPSGYDSSDKRVALVPNHQMIGKTNPKESDAYIPFMINCAKYLIEHQSKPFLLVHEGKKDQEIAHQIARGVGGIPIVVEDDPLKIKGILGTCDATIGSRFHGLVSALSQGIPSLATGWSHKYSRLFEDYGFTEGLVSVCDPKEDINKKINFLLNNQSYREIKKMLQDQSVKLKQSTREMWELVFTEINKRNYL